jgi:hypothetical protein
VRRHCPRGLASHKGQLERAADRSWLRRADTAEILQR